MENRKISNKGYVLATLSALLFALQVVNGKVILEMGFGAKNLMVFLYTWVSIVLFIFLIIRRKKVGGILPERKFIIPVIVQGIIGCALTSVFLYSAMETVAAGVCSMLLYLCPVYVCIFFMVTGIRKINTANKISVVMAFVGAVFVLNIFGLENMRWSVMGLFLGFLSGICYAFNGIYADLKLKKMPVEQMMFFMYLTAAVLVWILNPSFLSSPPEIQGTKMVLCLIAAMVLQVTPMALLTISIRMIGANRATVIATAELPFTVILAFIILSEHMVAIQLVGIAMITGAVVLLNVKKE